MKVRSPQINVDGRVQKQCLVRLVLLVHWERALPPAKAVAAEWPRRLVGCVR
jgi:hypothetical protein